MVNKFLERNTAIDLLRAFTMMLMVFVNDSWTITGVPHWMEHAAVGEDMLGLADIVFPSFLFVVGMSIPYAFHNMVKRGYTDKQILSHVFQRSFTLLLMGAFICHSEYDINTFYPKGLYWLLMVLGFLLCFNHYGKENRFATYGKILGAIVLLFIGITSRNGEGGLFAAHWWGILGSIGWTYMMCALAYYFFNDRKKVLAGIWIVLLLVNILLCSTRESLGLGGDALLNLSRPNFINDVLGIFHTGSASGQILTMSGILFVELYVQKRQDKTAKAQWIFAFCLAVILLVAGLLSNHVYIISKIGGTLPWILLVMSIDVVMYKVCQLLAPSEKKLQFILQGAGKACLTCYMIPYVFYGIFHALNIPWSVVDFGLAKSVVFVFACVGITYGLGKLNIKLKI